MNPRKYSLALIHYNRSSHFSVENEVFISLVAPATGIIIGIGIDVVDKYLEKRKKRKGKKLNSPKTIPVTVNSFSRFRKTLDRVTPKLVIRSVAIIYEKLVTSQSLRIAASSSFKVIDGIIIIRSVILSQHLLKYLLRTRENMFRITFNTLCWVVYSKERDKMVQIAFVVVTLISAKLWATKNRLIQRVLRIWVCITFLNLSNYIYVVPSLSRPSDIGVFGLPRVEHPIKQLNVSSETITNSKISMLGKEESLIISSPLQNEMPKDISKNLEVEINKIISNSTLGEENIILPQKEGLQNRKTTKSKLTSKPRRRMNSLQELNKTSGNATSLPIESDFEKVYNATKIKSDKVQ